MPGGSLSRGWPIEYVAGVWVYSDTKQPVSNDRACRRCKRLPTADGHDACLATLPNTESACCGHGAEKPFRIPPDSIPGDDKGTDN